MLVHEHAGRLNLHEFIPFSLRGCVSVFACKHAKSDSVFFKHHLHLQNDRKYSYTLTHCVLGQLAENQQANSMRTFSITCLNDMKSDFKTDMHTEGGHTVRLACQWHTLVKRLCSMYVDR